jgi:hypothetical protein
LNYEAILKVGSQKLEVRRKETLKLP